MELFLSAFVFAMISIALISRSPIGVPVGTFALLLPFDAVLSAGKLGSINLHVTWFVGAAAALLLFVAGVAGRRLERPPFTSVWLILLVLWASMSVFWAIDLDRATFRLPILTLLVVFYVLAASLRFTPQEVNVITIMAITGGFIAACISLYQFYNGQWWTSLHATEVSEQLSGRGTLVSGDRATNPNTVAATLVLPISLAIGKLLSASRKMQQLVWVFATAVMGTAIAATMSRGGLLAGGVVFIVYLYRSHAKRWMYLFPVIFALILACMPALFFSRLERSLVDRGTGRFDIWIVGLEIYKHYPIFGVGLNCFGEAYNQYLQVGTHFVRYSRAPHNIYLGTAVELGIIGLIVLLCAIAAHLFVSARTLRAVSDHRSRLKIVGTEAACWGLATFGLSLDLVWEQYFWLSLLLVVVIARTHGESQRHFCPISGNSQSPGSGWSL